MGDLILVLGATGAQGGGTARALKQAGFRVRALLRNVEDARARSLENAGIELVQGDLNDRDSISRAAEGCYGLFSVQPSATQPQYGIGDEDELRYGINAAETLELAGDTLSGDQLAEKLSRATGRTIPYSQLPAELLAQVPLLARIVELTDRGALAGSADIAALHELHPKLLTYDQWLERGGKQLISAAVAS